MSSALALGMAAAISASLNSGSSLTTCLSSLVGTRVSLALVSKGRGGGQGGKPKEFSAVSVVSEKIFSEFVEVALAPWGLDPTGGYFDFRHFYVNAWKKSCLAQDTPCPLQSQLPRVRLSHWEVVRRLQWVVLDRPIRGPIPSRP